MTTSGRLFQMDSDQRGSSVPAFFGPPQPELTYERTMVSIDSTDRNYSMYPSSTEYTLSLLQVFKNVVAIRLLSAEIPASFYVFSAVANTTTIYLKDGTSPYVAVTIPDGNYTLSQLCDALSAAILAATTQTYTVILNQATLKIIITSPTNDFMINTAEGSSTQIVNWGLGYFLGFNKGIYSSVSKNITAPNPGSINPYNYMILDLGGNLNMITENEIPKGYFAKVPINVCNFNYVYLTPECCSYNFARYDPPIGRLDKICIRWRFHDGRPINFNGYEHSFTLEIFTGEGKLKHPQINRI